MCHHFKIELKEKTFKIFFMQEMTGPFCGMIGFFNDHIPLRRVYIPKERIEQGDRIGNLLD